jgi:hypothetical protein
MTTAAVLPLNDYRALRRLSPVGAADARDKLHRQAAAGRTLAADRLATLVAEDPWWATPLRVPPATAALAEAAGRAALFDTDASGTEIPLVELHDGHRPTLHFLDGVQA